MIYVNILAAGTGSRMSNTGKPKQYLKIGDTPIIVHTAQKFLLFSEIDYILISVSSTWLEYTKNLFEEYGVSSEKIKLIIGGSERRDTITKTIEYIDTEFGIYGNDCLITHDSVRPFITHKIIQDHIDKVQEYSIVNTVIPAEDTIVNIEDGVVNIPVRDYYYQGQTPQSFQINEYLKQNQKLSPELRAELTDVVKIFTSTSGPELRIYNVIGEKSNFKITTPYDLKIANFLIKE